MNAVARDARTVNGPSLSMVFSGSSNRPKVDGDLGYDHSPTKTPTRNP